MTIEELKQHLDAIAWDEQVESELREQVSHPIASETDGKLRALAAHVDSALLDVLEREEGYLVWTLRLAPFVEHARARDRAQRHLDDPDWTVRQWAGLVAKGR